MVFFIFPITIFREFILDCIKYGNFILIISIALIVLHIKKQHLIFILLKFVLKCLVLDISFLCFDRYLVNLMLFWLTPQSSSFTW